MVSRTNRWRLAYGDGKKTEWLPRSEADGSLAKWDEEAAGSFEKATERVEEERARFLAETKVKILSYPNPNPFLVDFRKPTVTYPDGSTMQFEEGVSEEKIREAMEGVAREAHPDPSGSERGGSRPELESLPVWEAEFFAGSNRRRLPDISTWDHFFPMAGVIEILDELSDEGWSLLSASEDRGLNPSEFAEDTSVPLRVRYLLVQNASPGPAPR